MHLVPPTICIVDVKATCLQVNAGTSQTITLKTGVHCFMTSALSVLKSSGTSEFKLWWETSLRCEHLISPWLYATSHNTHTHARTHTFYWGSLLQKTELTGAWHKNYISDSCKPANSSHTHSLLLRGRTLTFCSLSWERELVHVWMLLLLMVLISFMQMGGFVLSILISHIPTTAVSLKKTIKRLFKASLFYSSAAFRCFNCFLSLQLDCYSIQKMLF